MADAPRIGMSSEQRMQMYREDLNEMKETLGRVERDNKTEEGKKLAIHLRSRIAKIELKLIEERAINMDSDIDEMKKG